MVVSLDLFIVEIGEICVCAGWWLWCRWRGVRFLNRAAIGRQFSKSDCFLCIKGIMLRWPMRVLANIGVMIFPRRQVRMWDEGGGVALMGNK